MEQYGIRIYSDDFKTMKWDEFIALLSGINHNTALGRMISIRSETNKDVLKEFTPEMRRMRAEWLNRNAKKVSIKERDRFLESMKNAFIRMAGETNG